MANNNTPTPKEWEELKQYFTIELDFYVRRQLNNEQPVWAELRDNILSKFSTLLSQQKQELVEFVEKIRKDCKSFPLKSANGKITDKTANNMIDVVIIDILNHLKNK